MRIHPFKKTHKRKGKGIHFIHYIKITMYVEVHNKGSLTTISHHEGYDLLHP